MKLIVEIISCAAGIRVSDIHATLCQKGIIGREEVSAPGA